MLKNKTSEAINIPAGTTMGSVTHRAPCTHCVLNAPNLTVGDIGILSSTNNRGEYHERESPSAQRNPRNYPGQVVWTTQNFQKVSGGSRSSKELAEVSDDTLRKELIRIGAISLSESVGAVGTAAIKDEQAPEARSGTQHEQSPVEVTADKISADLLRLEKNYRTVQAYQCYSANAFPDRIAAEEAELDKNLIPFPEIVREEVNLDEMDIGDESMSPEKKKQVREVIAKYKHLFINSRSALPPPARGIMVDLEPGAHTPIAQKARPVQQKYLVRLFELIKGMIANKLLTFGTSRWSSPIVIVEKKGTDAIRMCIDLREINGVFDLLAGPLPLIEDLFSNLESYLWLSSMDMASGFWSLLLTRRAAKILSLITPFGQFLVTRLPFGYLNAPQIYQRLVRWSLYGYIPPAEPLIVGCYATDNTDGVELALCPEAERPSREGGMVWTEPYLDDIFIGAKTWEEFLRRLEWVLRCLDRWNISISMKKSSFAKSAVKFLANQVTPEGRRVDTDRYEFLKSLSWPTTRKGLQSFLGSLIYYRRYVLEFPIVAARLYQVSEAELKSPSPETLRNFEELKLALFKAPELRYFEQKRATSVILYETWWAVAAVLVQRDEEGKCYIIGNTGRVLKETERDMTPCEREVIALLKMLKDYYVLLRRQEFQVWTKNSNLKWLLKNPEIVGRAERWAILLSSWKFTVERAKESKLAPAVLLAACLAPPEAFEKIMSPYAPVDSRVPLKVMGPPQTLLTEGYLLSFDGKARMKDRMGSWGYIIWKLPEWNILEARCGMVADVTVNLAEYHGVFRGMQGLQRLQLSPVVIVGDSQLVIRQLYGACRVTTEHLAGIHMEVRKLLRNAEHELCHVRRDYNASADWLTVIAMRDGMTDYRVPENLYEELHLRNRLGEGIKLQQGKSGDKLAVPDFTGATPGNAAAIPPMPQLPGKSETPALTYSVYAVPSACTLEVAEERRSRIRQAVLQDPHYSQVVKYLITRECECRGVITPGGEACRCGFIVPPKWKKIIAQYVTDEENNLYYYVPASAPRRWRRHRPARAERKLVVPAAMIDSVLSAFHDEIFGGHFALERTYGKISSIYYWKGMYGDVEKYVWSCIDCQTAGGAPTHKTTSCGNIVPTQPFQVIGMDILGPFPETENGNSHIILFICQFTGYICGGAMPNPDAKLCARMFELHCMQYFGACRILRHDRDPKFMSVFFKELNYLYGIRQIPTLSYRPCADGIPERTFRTWIRVAKKFCSHPEQTDWDVMFRLVMISMRTTPNAVRRDTPAYLCMGWDPLYPLVAMSVKQPPGNPDVIQWRNQLRREQTYVWRWTQEEIRANQQYARRRKEELAELRKSPVIAPGHLVWVYVPHTKAGYSPKLSHKWHGPFMVKSMSDDSTIATLELEHTAYQRMCPRVHVERLKRYRSYQRRPAEDPEVLPPCDWESALVRDDLEEAVIDEAEEEVKEILDRRVNKSRHGRMLVEYLVRWKDEGKPQKWVNQRDLVCGELLADYHRRCRTRMRRSALEVEMN